MITSKVTSKGQVTTPRKVRDRLQIGPDSPAAKRRPAPVLSGGAFNRNGHTILAMITTARGSSWPEDTPIDHVASGLPNGCVVRMQRFTLDKRLIEGLAGELRGPNRERVSEQLHRILLRS